MNKMPIFCTKCGSENLVQNRFCTKCGLPLIVQNELYSDNTSKEGRKSSLKKKVVIGIGIFFGMIMVLGAIGSSYDAENVNENENNVIQSTPIGTKNNPARSLDTIIVNNIAYTVMRYSERNRLGNSFSGDTADGIFIIIELELENLGTKSIQISDSRFKLIDSKGREFETDNGAWIYLENNILLKQLQPSLPTKGQIVFDVPNSITNEKYTLEIDQGDKRYVKIW